MSVCAEAVVASVTQPMSLKDVIATLEMARAISKSNSRPVGGYALKFSEPVCFSLGGRYYSNVRRFKFRKFKYEEGQGRLYFSVSRRARWMHALSYGVEDKIVGVEFLSPKKDAFASFEEFARRFDRRFVSEEKLRELWNGTSGQHGGKYRPSDFRTIGPRGRQVVQDFLRHYVDTKGGGPAYDFDGYHATRYRSCHHLGRDISVSHLAGNGLVWYSSEFHGCGNGSYYMLATEKTVMHIEND